MTLRITGDAAADRLLTEDPLALLIGMLLDQQVPMETAFAGPLKIAERAGTLDAADLAHANPEEFVDLFRQQPAVHRFPGSMAARVQALCAAVEQEWGGDAAALWTEGGPEWSLAMGTARAEEAGLTHRPFAETVRDTLAWAQANPDRATNDQWGMTPEREQELLTSWVTTEA